MAVKTTLNSKNLEALGVQRLAELLIEISTGSAAHKRRLRMELAGSHSSAEVAREVRKRLSSIARARTFINWRKVKSLKADLETQRRTIVDVVAADDPEEGFELIWQFLAIAVPVFERSDDGSGSLVESFHQACIDAGSIAETAAIGHGVLAERIFSAVQDNGYGQYDRLICAMIPALGEDGLEHLKALFFQRLKELEEMPGDGNRRVVGWSSRKPIYENDVDGSYRERTSRIALQVIADAQGDIDAYIAQQPEKTRRAPLVAADIAGRLLSSARAPEALETLDRADTTGRIDIPLEWQLARLQTLEALGRADEAQADRWTWFEHSLTDVHLRSFLKRLPDFDDLEAEEKAFAYAQTFPDVHKALAFLLHWPALAEAAKLIVTRKADLDGNLYELMTPASEALSAKHPLAATLALRSMIDFTLESGKSSRYRHAARHLGDCGALAAHIDDFADFGSHHAYTADLKRRHGKKHGFWSLVP